MGNQEVLLPLIERIEREQEKIHDHLTTISESVGRLAATVEMHDKHGMHLETILTNCRASCDAKFEKASRTERKIDTGIAILKWSSAVCGTLIAVAGLGFGILQAMSSVQEYGWLGLFESTKPTKTPK